jgi:two-component system, NtrC family, C4-dicarboxylate transport sensor histidine kinase DctB
MRGAKGVTIWIAIGLMLLGLAAIGRIALDQTTQAQFQQLDARARNTLALAEASLRGQLERFERLPGLLGENRAIRSLLLAPRDPELVMAANIYLRDTAQLLGASDIYIMYQDGETLAASNFDQPLSFVGGNFAFRPYFSDAMESGQGRFFALGTTSNKRGYYFGVVVDIAGQRRGVMVIKIDLDEIEGAWSSEEVRIIVTDPENIVFLSNRPDWLFRAFGTLTPERLARTQTTRRYANAPLTEIAYRRGPWQGFDLLAISGSGQGAEYLVARSDMTDAGWSVQVLLPTQSARLAARTSVGFGGLALGLLVLSGLILWQRRRQLAERLAVQQRAKAELEVRVKERTSQLAQANDALRVEVTERRMAEDRLRQTQNELVQAGKLAALGQMSAALSHEFNQPLAAARNYTENAQVLLDRDRKIEARDTLTRLLDMIDRMTKISRNLRHFARKPDQPLRPVALAEVVADARDLLGWRFQKSGASLQLDLDDTPLWVTAGSVRLQQVLVNLIGNALDAVEGSCDQRLILTARREGALVIVHLRDHGPGIAPALIDRIFDPFFSTKEVGKGLGLGLSITYNILRDFDGQISVRNHPNGGAEFTLHLHATDAPVQRAAE